MGPGNQNVNGNGNGKGRAADLCDPAAHAFTATRLRNVP